MSERSLGIIYTALSGLLFGFGPVLYSWSAQLGNTPATAVFFHGAVVVPAAFLFMKLKGTDMSITRKQAVLLFFAAIVHMLTNLFLDSSYRFIGVGIATAIHFLYPIVVALILKIYYRDVLTKRQIAALVCGLIGILLFSNVSGSANLIGIMLAAASSLAYSLYLIFLDRTELVAMDAMKALFWMCAVYVVVMFVSSLIRPGLIRWDMPLKAYVLTVLYSLNNSLLGALLMKVGISKIGSKLGSILSLLEPISSMIFGIILLAESISFGKGLGAVFMIAAMLMMLK